MTLPVFLSPEAEADLVEVAAWHEKQSVGLGVELVIEVRNALHRVINLKGIRSCDRE